MKLLSVEFENFLSTEEKQILPVADQGLVLIDGKNLDEFDSNGAGKSTVLNAISYGAYGATLHSDPKPKIDEIPFRGNKKPMKVKHVYEDGYVIERGRRPTSLVFNKGDVPLAKPDPKETQKDIERILFNGLNYEYFSRVFVYDKKSIAAFINGSESGNKRFVENIFQMENYDNYLDSTKKLVKQTKERIETLQGRISNSRNDIESYDQKQADFSEKAEKFEEEKRLLLTSIQEQISVLEDKISELEKVDIDKEKGKIDKNIEIENQIQDIAKKLVRIEIETEALNEKVVLWNKTKDVDVVKEQDNLKKQSQIEKYLDEAVPKKAKLESDLSVLQNEIDEQDKIRDIDVASERTKLDDYESKKEKLFQKSMELQISMENNYKIISEKEKYKKSEICPTCKQKILNVQEHNEHLTQELNDLRVKVENTRTLLDKVLDAKINLSVATYSKDQLDVIEKLQAKELTKVKIELLESISVLEKNIEKCQKAKSSLKYSENELLSIQELQKSNPEEKQGKLTELKKQLEEKSKVLESEKLELSYTLKDLETICINIRDKKKELIDTNERLIKEKGRKNDYAVMSDEYRNKKEATQLQLTKFEEELVTSLEHLKHYTFWQQAFDKNGIKMLVLSQAIDIINSKVNHYLSMLGSSHQVKYDSNLDEVGCHYATTSTGERQRINIALLFSCLEIVLNTFNLGYLCIDEVFDGMDRSFTPNLMETLKVLSKKVGTIFLITHNDEIKSEYSEYFDKFVTVQKKNGKSKLIIN